MLGSTIGGYAIVSELGTGGMGTVYLGQNNGDRVAVKVVHPHLLATPGYFKRFLREAELGKQIRHENVVRTFDVDATQLEGEVVHYMVMEHVEGKSLRALLSDLGTIPEPLLREIALQAARGLAAIHAKAVVHRDLKPENILITEDNAVRIMDLGVAKLQEASIALTREGQFTGSLLYAAPEQFRHEDVGPAADLYALGVMLYELATGHNPFRYPDPAAVIQAHLGEVPPRAHERNEELSHFFSEVIATLLAKQPARRFESAARLREVLEEAERSAWWTEHEPVDAPRLPTIRVNRETALHGRDKSLATLRELYELAAAGNGQTLWLEGEAGIGKTRLIDAFVREAGDEAHVLYGSYPPSGGLGGFSDAILGKFGAAGLTETLAPYLTVTPSLVPAFAAMVKHEAPPTGSEPLNAGAVQAAAVHLMRALAAEKPTIWIIDDLHFASEESRALVLALARAVEGERALVIATSRPGLDLAHFSRLDNFRRLEVGRLSPRQVQLLLHDAFRSDLLADQLGAKIALKSDGVPFFVFEMIRTLKEHGLIREEDDGSYVQTQPVEEIEVPSAVKDLVHQRMKDLTEDQRAILDVGAVQGMEFRPGLVAAVLEEKKVRVLRQIAEIERRFGLVRGEAGVCRFDQNQIQEVLYRDLLPDLRTEYHALLAEAYDGDDPVFLAHHHLRGSRPEQARPHLMPALDRLEKSYRNEEVLDLAARALQTEGLLAGAERVDVLLKQASRLDLLGRRDEQRLATDEAVAVADDTGDAVLRGKARNAHGVLLFSRSDNDAAQDLLRETLELAQTAEDKKLEATATRNLGNVLLNLGRATDAQEQFERSRALSREIEDRRGEASATGNLGNALNRLGRLAEAIEHHEIHRTLCQELGDRRGEAGATGNLGLACQGLGRAAEAQQYHERCRALSREIGYRRAEAIATGNLGGVLAALGRLGEAGENFERFRVLSREIGDRRSETIAVNCLGNTYLNLGRYEEAQEYQERSLALCREIGEREIESFALHNLAAIAETTRGAAEAARLYKEALALRRELGAKHLVTQTLIELGRVEADPAPLDEAIALAREIENPAALFGALLERASLPGGDVAAVLAAAAERESELDARTHFRLWKLTDDATHLATAKRKLDDLVKHVPEEDRDSILERHKEIRDAR